jgi:universal stress protein E
VNRPDNFGYRRIQVATDFSFSGTSATRQAVWLAKAFDAELVVTHTIPDLRQAVYGLAYHEKVDLFTGPDGKMVREMDHEPESLLKKSIFDLGGLDLKVRFETFSGEPYEEIISAALRESHDLVMVGTRGNSAWEQFIVGSTAKRLIRHCPTSVWIVKAEHAEPPRSILATTDFSDTCRRAVDQAWAIAQQSNADFKLLHVIDERDFPEQTVTGLPEGEYIHREIMETAIGQLRELAQDITGDQGQVETYLAWGTPWREIQGLVQQLKPDLLAMGTVGRRGLQGLVVGNTAEKILDVCDCSMLTVKPSGFRSPITVS